MKLKEQDDANATKALSDQTFERLATSSFVKACRGEATACTPIWLNRQAGRYMPEYRARKAKYESLELFTVPDLMVGIAVEAQQILQVDAAILFTDILPILIPAGFQLEYVAGTGPVIKNPIRQPQDVAKIHPVQAAESMSYIAVAVAETRAELPPEIPLIGFTGAPFTLSAYAIEGQGSKNYTKVKQFMYQLPDAWHQLMKHLTDAVISCIKLQIKAGVQAVQLFDSWVGCLSIGDFRQYVLPYTRHLIQAVKGTVPIIYFGTDTLHLLPEINQNLQPDCLALDWRSPLKSTWDSLNCKAVQGNLDPALLFADWHIIEKQAKLLLDQVAEKPGHIFNLGHGILPQTPVDNVKRLVDFVHQYSSRVKN